MPHRPTTLLPTEPDVAWPQRRCRLALLLASLGCLIVLVIVGAVVWHVHGPLEIESKVAHRFVGGVREFQPLHLGQPDRWPLALLVLSGEPVFFTLALLAMATVALKAHDRLLAWLCVVGPILAVVITTWIGKPLVARLHETADSYPSGHCTASAALAMCVFFLIRRVRGSAPARRSIPLLALLPLGTAIGVVMLHWHYPTDAIGGWAMGGGVVMALGALVLRPLPSR